MNKETYWYIGGSFFGGMLVGYFGKKYLDRIKHDKTIRRCGKTRLTSEEKKEINELNNKITLENHFEPVRYPHYPKNTEISRMKEAKENILFAEEARKVAEKDSPKESEPGVHIISEEAFDASLNEQKILAFEDNEYLVDCETGEVLAKDEEVELLGSLDLWIPHLGEKAMDNFTLHLRNEKLKIDIKLIKDFNVYDMLADQDMDIPDMFEEDENENEEEDE